MSAEIPSIEPMSIIAGDTAKWYKVHPDYSAGAGWVLKYRLVGGTIAHEVTADVEDGTWLVNIAAATLAAIVADTMCRLVGWVEKGDEKWTVYDGYTRVLPNPRTATAAQLKTKAETTYDIICTAIDGRLTADIEDYQINGRAVKKIPIKELHELKAIYAAIVWRERNPGASFPSHAVRFGAARD